MFSQFLVPVDRVVSRVESSPSAVLMEMYLGSARGSVSRLRFPGRLPVSSFQLGGVLLSLLTVGLFAFAVVASSAPVWVLFGVVTVGVMLFLPSVVVLASAWWEFRDRSGLVVDVPSVLMGVVPDLLRGSWDGWSHEALVTFALVRVLGSEAVPSLSALAVELDSARGALRFASEEELASSDYFSDVLAGLRSAVVEFDRVSAAA